MRKVLRSASLNLRECFCAATNERSKEMKGAELEKKAKKAVKDLQDLREIEQRMAGVRKEEC